MTSGGSRISRRGGVDLRSRCFFGENERIGSHRGRPPGTHPHPPDPPMMTTLVKVIAKQNIVFQM